MAQQDIVVRMGMDASEFNRALQSSQRGAAAAASSMASLEKAIKDRSMERMSVAEKINALRKDELELANRAFALEAAGDKAGAAKATLAALNTRTERERLITSEKQKQLEIEKDIASEKKRVLDIAAKQAQIEKQTLDEALFRLEKTKRERSLERMTAQERINALKKEEIGLLQQSNTLAAKGDKIGAANAANSALNLRTERERLITAEKQKQVALEQQLAIETKKVADAAAKQAHNEAKFRADLSERVRLEKQAAQLRHAPQAKEPSGIASRIGGTLTSVAGAFGVGLGLASVVGWLDRISERMVGLRRQSEDVGASMSFMAGLSTLEKELDIKAGSASAAMTVLAEQIGRARTEGGEAMEKFERFGISLYDASGQARTGEEVFKAISTAIAGTSDAATKAALTYEFFGKTGREVNNIIGMGGQALDAFVASQKRSEGSLQMQAKSWELIRNGIKGAAESAGDYVSKLALAARVAKASLFGILTGDIKGQSDALRASLAPEKQQRGTKKEDEAANMEKRKRDQQELARIAKERADFEQAQRNDAEKIAALDDEMVKDFEKLKTLQAGSVEHAKLELEFAKKRAEFGKLVNKQAEDKKKHDKEQIKIADDLAKRQKEAERRAKEIRGERGTAITQAAEVRGERLKFTLEDLAGANARRIGDPQLRKDILAAREVARLESQAGFLKQRGGVGDLAEAAKRLSVADKVRAGITSIRDTERFPFANMDSNIASIDDTMEALLTQAKTDGLNVRALMAN